VAIQVFDAKRDAVINSSVAVAATNYSFALEKLFPLLDRFDEQRKVQSKKFYSRLRKDIITGCIMPPITLAFVDSDQASVLDARNIEYFVNNNIKQGYILDGMQRLNTLKDAAEDSSFDYNRPLYMNIIVAERYDLLLYRMITLNNGQKPMTARHQIEMLTKGVIDTSGLTIEVVTEKETEGTKIHGAFRRSDVVESYIAYFTDSVNNQNSKIIESKLDEIIVGKVMEANISDVRFTFTDILRQVDKFSAVTENRDWFRQVNNLIGFTVGAKKSCDYLDEVNPRVFRDCVNRFEKAFESINPSKVNVGKFRRELVQFYINNIEDYIDADVSTIEAAFFEQTLAE
jgi:hypothetical protein